MIDITTQINSVIEKFPYLEVGDTDSILQGNIFLPKDDLYEVKIDFVGFPDKLPRAFEVGERIPPKADRHKYSNHMLCLTTEAQSYILVKTKVKTLTHFIELILLCLLYTSDAADD